MRQCTASSVDWKLYGGVTLRPLLVLAAIIPLAACATASSGFPMYVWGTQDSVAYSYDPLLAKLGGPDQEDAEQKAQAYCQKYSKHAKYSSTSDFGGAGMVEAIFDCVSP